MRWGDTMTDNAIDVINDSNAPLVPLTERPSKKIKVRRRGRVTKWLAITVLGMFAGMVLLGESVAKVIAWLWPPPHP